MILPRSTPCLLLFLGVLGGLGVQAASPAFKAPTADEIIEIESLAPGEVLYNPAKGTALITNTFVVRFRDATLTAQRGAFDQTAGRVSVEGGVALQQDNQVWRGESLEYDYLTRTIRASDFRAGRWPVYAAGSGLTLDLTNRVYTATNAFVAADDVKDPGFRVRTRKLTIAPGKYFVARHAVLYAGDVPIFYFPYLRRNLDRYSNHFNVVPGYRSRYGAYLLGSYEWYWTERLNGIAHLDYRSKRGVGTGLDVSYEGGRWGRTDLEGYYLHDLGLGEVEGFDGGPVDLDKDRYRISLLHQSEPWTNLTVKLAYREQGDPYVVRDFFETEYRRNTQPASFLEVDRLWPNLSLNVLAQPQVNDFYETVERLPDVKLTASRQQLWSSPLFYEGESSVGYLRRNFASGSTNQAGLLNNDYAALRADTFHQLLLPRTFLGWLNVTPRAGGRFTYYGDTTFDWETNRPSGFVDPWNERTRWVFNTGMELSFKASRLWADATNHFFQVDGLRHIVQPSFNYAYVPAPSALPGELPQFDQELPSLRLLPNQFPDYNAIDSVDARNVLRLGLHNKLQTKRDGQVDNLLNWDLYTDWRLERQGDQGDFSDVFSDLDLKPWSWVTLTSELRVDPERARLIIANHMLTLEPNDRWSWTFGHRYLREDPEAGWFNDHSLLISTFYYRFNEDWGLRLSHHYEINDHTMEEQYYTVYRDFRSWTGALTFRVRDHRTTPIDYGVAFTFQLKAFPRFKPGDDRNEPALLLGY